MEDIRRTCILLTLRLSLSLILRDKLKSASSSSLSLLEPPLKVLDILLMLFINGLLYFCVGSDINGRAFREAGGSICVMDMIYFKRYRRMALRLMTQLILLDGKD